MVSTNRFLKNGLRIILLGLFCQGVVAEGEQNMPARAASAEIFPFVQGASSLTIAGNGYWNREVYEAGEQPRALSAFVQTLPDGVYRYELRSIPATSEADRGLAGGAPQGRSWQKGQQAELASGKFKISGGLMDGP
jgi:hypothetical protein